MVTRFSRASSASASALTAPSMLTPKRMNSLAGSSVKKRSALGLLNRSLARLRKSTCWYSVNRSMGHERVLSTSTRVHRWNIVKSIFRWPSDPSTQQRGSPLSENSLERCDSIEDITGA